jgi:hypothetical protein
MMAMKSISVAVILLVSAVLGQAQVATPTPELYSTQTINEMRSLMQAALSSDYAYRQTAYLSNNIGPRLTGSPQAGPSGSIRRGGNAKAGARCSATEALSTHTGPWRREGHPDRVFREMAPGTTQKIVVTALGGSIATPRDGMTGEIVVVNSIDELNALGREKSPGR